MKAVLLLVTLAVAFGLQLKEANFAFSSDRQHFQWYMQRFGKQYTSDEYETRFSNFVATLARQKDLQKNITYKVGLNKFSDMSVEEFQKVMLMPQVPSQALAQSCLSNGVTHDETGLEAPPTSFDWRTKNVVTGVKDQGQCGSCWAFSTIGNIEAQWALKGNALTGFSEQLIVDCSHGCSNEPPYGTVCNQGCNGGWQWNAFFDVISFGGVETETQYPYTAQTGTCALNKQLVQAPIKAYVCLTNPNTTGVSEDVMASYSYANGPLSFAMDATPLMDYSSGIITSPSCSTTSLDHALLIVGWGVDATAGPFWIVKNSWSNTWGENGYFRIQKGIGACGINMAVSIAQM